MRFFLCALFMFPFLAYATDVVEPCHMKMKGHRFFLGPEVYHVHRTREGGTHQEGWLAGGRFLYDHMRRYTLYWAAEGAIARGTIRGKSGSKAPLKSRMRDRTFEARFGYTLQCKNEPKFSLTPFIGVGYLAEDNFFKHPSPLPLHFKVSYRYLTAGFISSINVCQQFNVGLTLKVRHLIDPECQISNDPDYKSVQLHIDNDILQYRIELPLTYVFNEFSLVATPFYETRIYGKSAGYPFDFLKTQLFNYGLSVQARLIF